MEKDYLVSVEVVVRSTSADEAADHVKQTIRPLNWQTMVAGELTDRSRVLIESTLKIYTKRQLN
jgi:hypothetical protein